MTKLLFFTYANEKYELFALPYAYFCLRNNNNAKVEIILENATAFHQKHQSGVDALNEIFPNQVIFRQSTTVAKGIKYKPHVIRFIEEPTTKSEYIYIGDIDIMIFEDVFEIHSAYMNANNLPFSNIVRTGTEKTAYPRLTGLHFCPTSLMYPLPDIEDLDINARNDENVLFEIMQRKGPMVPLSFRDRPLCGIHISLNRDSIGRYSVNRGDEYLVGNTFNWGINRYESQFIDMLNCMSFSKMFFCFSMEYRALIMVIESAIRGDLRELHRISSNFLVDKRLSVSLKKGKRVDLLETALQSIEEKSFVEALGCLHNIINIWPSELNAYVSLSKVYFELSDVDMAIEALLHASDLSVNKRQVKAINEIINGYRDKIENHPQGQALLIREMN
jgi:tetratricopeptide (TPR) repeat protein